jgi:hypothetical protein
MGLWRLRYNTGKEPILARTRYPRFGWPQVAQTEAKHLLNF